MLKKNVSFIVIVSSIFLITPTFGSSAGAINFIDESRSCNGSIANWTVMYYLCGDSHLCSETGPLLENLSNMGSTNELNIVALRDNDKIGDTKLYYINDTGEKIVLNDEFGWPDEVDTGDPNTLKLFCKQMMRYYPAKYYGLVSFSAGGSGWQGWTLYDSHGKHKMLSLPEFADTLKDITNDGIDKIDVVFTPCIMSMIEVAYELAPYVNYLATTEEHTPDGPLHYQRFYRATWDLRNNTSMTPEEFANRAPIRHKPHNFSFFTDTECRLAKLFNKLPFPELHTISMHTTYFAVNLSVINDLVDAVEELSSILVLNNNIEEVKKAIKIARCNVREYGKGYAKYGVSVPILKYIKNIFHPRFPLEINSFDSYIDLYNFADLLSQNVDNPGIKTVCYSVMEKLNRTITAKKVVPDDESHGLSIYFPDKKILYNRYIFGGKAPHPYEELKFSQDTSWDEFLKNI